MNHHPSERAVFLSEVIQNYRNEVNAPKSILNQLGFHEKNPAAKQQIELLELIRTYIDKNLHPLDRQKAELGALLILRALFSDPDDEQKVFYYLIDKIKLDEQINHALKQINPALSMDPINPDYIRLSKEAIRACKKMIEMPEIEKQFKSDSRFIKDLLDTIFTELDYDDKILFSIHEKTSNKLNQNYQKSPKL